MSGDDGKYRSFKENDTIARWIRRLIISLTVLIWIVLTGIVLWLLGQVSQAVILLLLGSVIATVIYPLIQWLARFMPRALAVALVYILVVGIIGSALYFIANIAVNQIISLKGYIQSLINAHGNSRIQPFIEKLQQLGLSSNQLRALGQHLLAQLQGILDNVLPFISNLSTLLLNIVLVALLSIYFVLTGPRITRWLRHKTPVAYREQISFLLDTLDRVIGGNFRGLLLLACIISTLTGIGLFFIGVPYAFLLSILAFILEFIPVIGFYITALAIVLMALTQGWMVGLFALILVSGLQFLEGEVLSPRILGREIGINPIIMIAALIAGNQLFGIIGAVFAGSAAGTIQAVIVACWSFWKQTHPHQFPDKSQSDPAKDRSSS
jgi:predicted PurR-regulated permease PerM